MFSQIKLSTIALGGLLLFAACSTEHDLLADMTEETENGLVPTDSVKPGFFNVYFTNGLGEESMSRGYVDGVSKEVRVLDCYVYQSDAQGNYKYYTHENVFGRTADGAYDNNEGHSWSVPFSISLPRGHQYKVAFLGNVEEGLFNRVVDGKTYECNQLLTFGESKTLEESNWDDVRVNMPSLPFEEGKNLFYMDQVTVDEAHTVAPVVMERMVSKLELSRVLVNTESGQDKALVDLTAGLVNYLGEEELVTQLVDGFLGKNVLQPVLKSIGVTAIEEALLANIKKNLVESLELKEILSQNLSVALTEVLMGNSQNSLLGELLNPWKYADQAVIRVKQMPKNMNLDGRVQDQYVSDDMNKYCYITDILKREAAEDTYENFITSSYINLFTLTDGTEKSNAKFGQIDANRKDFLGGYLINETVEDAILQGGLIGTDPDGFTYKSNRNYAYENKYSTASILLKDNPTENPDNNLKVTLSIKEIADLEYILKPAIEKSFTDLMGNETVLDREDVKDFQKGLLGSVLAALLKPVDFILGGLWDLLGLPHNQDTTTIGQLITNITGKDGGLDALVNGLLFGAEPNIWGNQKFTGILSNGVVLELDLNLGILQDKDNLTVTGGWSQKSVFEPLPTTK